jgi:hypothetical protein
MRPYIERYEKLVGTVALPNQVVEDSIGRYPAGYLFPAAATRPPESGLQYVEYHFQLNKSGSVARVERELIAALPPGATYSLHDTSIIEGQVDRSIRSDALALGVFAVLALAAALFCALQVISRRLQGLHGEQIVLRALGTSRRPSPLTH